MSSVICGQCNNKITTDNYASCYSCKHNYHFFPCCSLTESAYNNMQSNKKRIWKCHNCEPRGITNDRATSKHQRTEDEDSDCSDRVLSLSAMNSNLCSTQSDVSEIKTDLKEIKTSLEQVVTNVNNSNLQIKEDIQNALLTITTTISSLVAQVSELNEKDKHKEKQINELESRVNKLEQQNIANNIEIKNIKNKNISPFEIVKKIAESVNVNVSENDINRAYRLKQKDEKLIVEFATINKKKEFMEKIERHRVEAKLINREENTETNNSTQNNNNNNYIYINDQLTLNNRKLLWSAKTKAKESGWKFVWVRNGNIYVKKNENSTLIVINNAADIELIN